VSLQNIKDKEKPLKNSQREEKDYHREQADRRLLRSKRECKRKKDVFKHGPRVSNIHKFLLKTH
jgi:hypothetical protein